jgi:tRNA 2-thiouridine synthesizing protein A
MSRWFGRADASTPSAAVAAPQHTDGAAPGEGPLVTIDALGRKCPIPIIMLAQRINEVPIGSVIAVLADDPAAETDVPSWCMMKSHDHVRTLPLERGWAILIRRGY